MAAFQAEISSALAVKQSGKSTNVAADSFFFEAEPFDLLTADARSLPADAQDYTIGMGALTTGKALLIASDKQILIKVNNDPTGFLARGVCLHAGEITSLVLNNPGLTAATVRVVLAGV